MYSKKTRVYMYASCKLLETCSLQTARHNTHRQTARVPVEVSSDDEEHKTTALSPRRSHRARTPTRYFLSEVPTPRKRRSVTPKPTASTEREEESSTEEEEEEDSEGGKETVERSEYDLQSYAMLRRSPRRKNSTHYFNLELPQPRKQGSGKGWVAEDDTATPDEVVMSQGNQPTREAKRTTVAHSLALSSDEEGRGEGGKSVTPRISLYETRMRERLGKLTSVTKKQVTDAFSSLTARKSDPPSSSSSTSSSFQPQPDQPPTTRSQAKSKPPSKSSLATTLSSSVYETRSRMTWSQPLVLSPPATQMSLRSSKTITTTATATTTLSPPDQTKGVLSTDSPPPPLDPSSVTEPVELPPTPPQGYPQWMRFGCDEVVLLLVVFSLILFAYYCFHSDGC